MAGGTFDPGVSKVRPGTYINVQSTRQEALGSGTTGTVIVPLIGHNWGPGGEFITISGTNPDGQFPKLGRSVYSGEGQLLLIREALKRAEKVIAYIPKEGARAKKISGNLTATAKFGGSRGNDLKYSVVANPTGGFDVTVFLDLSPVGIYEGLTTIEQLAAASNEFILFSGSGDLTAVSGEVLGDGTDGVATNEELIAFLDGSEGLQWNTMCFPMLYTAENAGLFAALKSKIKYLREEAGKYRMVVTAGFSADYEGIINVTNSVVLNDGTALTTAQATAYVAGLDASASYTTSNTGAVYEGASDIVKPKTHAEAVAAINNGETFFSFSEANEVVVEYDINSLITFTDKKDKSYRKNRVLRVFDDFAERCKLTFPPNKFNNDSVGWDVMEGLGRALLQEFADAGAITEVDYEADFVVDRGRNAGDEAYFTVGLKPVDSAEKLYFTINTR